MSANDENRPHMVLAPALLALRNGGNSIQPLSVAPHGPVLAMRSAAHRLSVEFVKARDVK